MAELDDFFAKKDRKKGKTVKKFSTAEEIVKKIEDTKVKNDIKIKKDRQPAQGQEGEDGAAMPGDEDEWREYEVAKKDYTGLKIQPLTGQEQREGSGGEQGEGGVGGQQQGGQGRPGPWNKSNEGGEGKEEVQPPPSARAQLPPPVASPAPSSGAPAGYVPPSMRNRLAGQGPPGGPEGPRGPGTRNVKMHAPDIHSEEYFPTLGGEKKPPAGAWTEAGGGSARAGSGGPASRAAAPLSLGNRFTSLTNDS